MGDQDVGVKCKGDQHCFPHDGHLSFRNCISSLLFLMSTEDAPCVVLLDSEGCTSSKLPALLDCKKGCLTATLSSDMLLKLKIVS